MGFEIEGKLHVKNDTVQITDTFKKREFVLEVEDGAYPQVVSFQLIQDKCPLLDAYEIGDQMKIHFNLKGRAWTNKEGQTKYFNSLDCWRIEKLGAAETAANVQKDDSFPSTSDEPSIDNNDDLPF